MTDAASTNSVDSFVEPTIFDPSIITYDLECSSVVRKTTDQDKPVLLMNRGEWYKVRYQLADGATVTETTGLKLKMTLTFANLYLQGLSPVLFHKYFGLHPHDNLFEVRLPPQDDASPEAHHFSEEPMMDLLLFDLPLPQSPLTSTGLGSNFFYIRINAVATQFFYDERRNHPLMMPFDFGLTMMTLVHDQTMVMEGMYYPIKVTWPGRADDLSTTIQSRYDRYGSLKMPQDRRQTHRFCPLSMVLPSGPSTRLYTALQVPTQLDPHDGLPITFLPRSQPLTLVLKPLISFHPRLYRTTIALVRHRSTSRSVNPLVQYIEYNHRFVVQYEKCKLTECVYDVYFDPRNNSVEVIWIPATQVELCLQFEWQGALAEEVAGSKVQLVVETTQMWGNETIIEHVGCVVKFRDLASSNPDIASLEGRPLAKITQFALPKHRHHHRSNRPIHCRHR